MKKLSIALIISVFALSACTSTTNNNISNDDVGFDEDTVLWVNADGTDCDYGDWLEGDKDCDKQKKKTYVDSKSLNKKAKTTKKSSILKSSNKKKSDKKKYGKKSTKKSSKRK